MKLSKRQKNILNNYYFDVSNPAAYAGPDKLFRALNKKYPNVFSRTAINAFLSGVDSYTESKTPRRRFHTPKVLVTDLYDQLEIDLTSVQNLSKYNDGVRYLMFIIDVMSRFLWVLPLPDKKAQTILKALRGVIDNLPRPVLRIRTDMGSEFVNTAVKKYLKDKDIYFFTTKNPVKASIVERVQRTIKQRLYRYLRHNRTRRYIDILSKLIQGYNNSKHSSLNFEKPINVNSSM